MTGEFSADWLSLREPYDAASRSRELALSFLEALPHSPRIIDLGAGRGSNARYLDKLAARVPNWRLIDRDQALLEQATGIGGEVETQFFDFAPKSASIDFSKTDAVTGSALFDLVSRYWFAEFVQAAAGLPLLLALTVNGEFDWQPTDSLDDEIMASFRGDMQRDKGFGPAMGVAAPAIMVSLLEEAGYRVNRIPSPWHLGPEAKSLLTMLIDFVAEAARRGCKIQIVDAWRGRRQELAMAGKLRLIVGHEDILALP